jgi:hypothetical protein
VLGSHTDFYYTTQHRINQRKLKQLGLKFEDEARKLDVWIHQLDLIKQQDRAQDIGLKEGVQAYST